ncbi:MAG: transporter [Gammaproteobacteria bacterium]|nr:transporter [Gammaproteobacteria bacterium]
MQTWKKYCVALTALWSSQALAGGFLLWEQNGAGVGDYHAGYAVDAADASTEFYNPAGLTYLKNTQAVAGLVIVPTKIEYTGTVQVSTINPPPVAAQYVSGAPAGGVNAIPDFHFAQALSPRLWWGLGVNVPFGLATDYSTDTYLRYGATKTQLQTIDVTPSLGYKLFNNFSVGAGLDAVYAQATFDQYSGFADNPFFDTLSDNRLSSWGYGYHLGALYQVTPRSRLGLAYHSKVDEEMTGRSRFVGYLANSGAFLDPLVYGEQISNELKSSLSLPPYTTLSGLYNLTQQWTLLGSVTYTQWSYIKALELQNLAIADSSTGTATNNGVAYINQDFRNTWNVALGAEYAVSPKVMLRTGVGYDQTPVRDSSLRYIPTPDADRYAVAVGGHYQVNKKVGTDIGWTHLFILNAPVHSSSTVGVNPNNPNPNGQTVTANGTVNTTADVFGFQLSWNFD